jgi:hypothetical protein
MFLCRVAKAMLSQHKFDVASVRALFEDALSQCGLHLVEGDSLWDNCLDFELSLDGNDRDDERIKEIFSRFLQTPFPPDVVERTKAKFKEWLKDEEISQSLMRGIERAQRAYGLRQDYEAALVSARIVDPHGLPLLSIYYSYINLEISGGIHARVRMVFERAFVDFPTSEFLWKNVLAYEESVGRHDQLPGLQLRAIRYCRWSGDIWSMYLHQKSREIRNSHGNENILDSILESAYANLCRDPLEYQKVLLARAFSLKHATSGSMTKYHDLLRDGILLLKEMNIVVPDHYCATLLSHSLAIEGDVRSGKAVWENLLSDTCLDSQYSGTWLSYYTFLEVFVDDFKEARDIFKRSVIARMSLADHEFLAKTWLIIEQKKGTQESLKEALYLTSGVQRQYEASQLGIDKDFQEVMCELRVPAKENEHKVKLKRKRVHNMSPGDNQDAISKSREVSKAGNSQVPKYIVFMKHITPSVTENDIKDEFTSCGDDMDVNIGRDPKTGRSKGYAYIRCETKQTFDNLCALDGREFHGRNLFIAPSAPPKGKRYMQVKHGEYSEPKERAQKQRLAPAIDMIPRAAVASAPKSNNDFRNMFL